MKMVNRRQSKDGKLLVKMVALDTPSPKQIQRLGFMSAEMKVPDDFDRLGDEEIGRLFGVSQ